MQTLRKDCVPNRQSEGLECPVSSREWSTMFASAPQPPRAGLYGMEPRLLDTFFNTKQERGGPSAETLLRQDSPEAKQHIACLHRLLSMLLRNDVNKTESTVPSRSEKPIILSREKSRPGILCGVQFVTQVVLSQDVQHTGRESRY